MIYALTKEVKLLNWFSSFILEYFKHAFWIKRRISVKNWIQLSKLQVKVHFESKNDIIWDWINGCDQSGAFILTFLISWISIGNSVRTFHTFKISHLKCSSKYQIRGRGDRFGWIIVHLCKKKHSNKCGCGFY